MRLVEIPDSIGTPHFQTAHSFVLGQEGEDCWQGAGEDFQTCFGIAERFNSDLAFPLSRDEAIQVAYDRYWVPSGAEALPLDLAIMHFDHSFNAGNGAATKIFIESKGDFCTYAAYRLLFYADDRRAALFKINGRGWTRRVADCTLYASGFSESSDMTHAKYLVLNHLSIQDRLRILSGGDAVVLESGMSMGAWAARKSPATQDPTESKLDIRREAGP